MKILVLEDDSYRVTTFIEMFCMHDLYITESASNAIKYLEDNVFDYIFLDNDLGTDNGEGLDVATYLEQNPENENNNAVMIIHSLNYHAAKIMQSKLRNSKHIPFGSYIFFSLKLDNEE